MESYGDSVNLYNGALESAGATQVKYNTYLDSTEAHLNKLKASAEGAWMKIFNSDAIKDFVDAGAKIIDVFGKIASDGHATIATLTAILAVVMMFKKELKFIDFKKIFNFDDSGNKVSTSKFSIAIKNMSDNIKIVQLEMQRLKTQEQTTGEFGVNIFSRFNTAIKNLTGSTIGAKIGMGLLSGAGAILSAGLTVLASVAIGAIINGIVKWINKSEELKKKSQELLTTVQQTTQNNNNNIQSLIGMEDEYTSLAGKTNLTIQEQQRLHEMQNQIAQMSPQVVTGYDSQGNAIVNLTSGVKGLVESLREENEIQNQRLATEGGSDAFGSFAKSIKNERSELEKATITLKGYQDQYKQYKETYESNSPDVDKTNLLEQMNETQRDISKTAIQINQLNSKIRESQSSLLPYARAVAQSTSSYKELNKEMQTFIDQQVQNMDFSKFKNWDEASEAIGKLVDSLHSVEGISKFNAIQKLNDDLKNARISTEEYNKQIIILISELAKILGISPDELSKRLAINSDSLDKAVSSLSSLEEMEKKLASSVDASAESIKNVNKILNEHTKTNEWDLDSIINLAKEYPQLLGLLGDEKGLEAELIKIKTDKVNATIADAKNQIKVESDLVLQLAQAYGIDVSNVVGSEEAKVAAVSDGVKKRIALLAQERDAYLTVKGETEDEDIGFSNIVTNKFDKEIAKFQAVSTHIDNIYKLSGVVANVGKYLSNVGASDYDGKSNGGGGGSSNNTTYESKLDGMDKYTSYLDDINNQLEKQDDLISDISDKNKVYQTAGDRDSLLKSLELETQQYTEQARKLATLKQDTGLISAQMGSLSQQFKSSWGAMAGADLSTWTRTNFTEMFQQLFPTKTFSSQEQQDAYEKQKAKFNQLTDDWFKYADEMKTINNDILSAQNDMISTMQERYDTYFKVLDSDISAYKDKIDEVQYEIDTLGNDANYDQREQATQNLIAKTTTYRNAIQNTLSSLEQHVNTLQRGSVEWSIVNSKIDEYSDSLQDANSQLRTTGALLEQIRQEEVNTAQGLEDNIISALNNKYSQAKQNELDALEAQRTAETTALETQRQNELDGIAQNRQAELDAIAKRREDELNALEQRKTNDINRANAELKQLQDELKALQDTTDDTKSTLDAEKQELALWEKDDSAYAEGKVLELKKDIADKEKQLAINAKQAEIDAKQQEVDTITQKYEDLQSSMEKSFDDMQKTAEDAYDKLQKTTETNYDTLQKSTEETYNNMQKGIESTYDNLLSDQNLYNEATQLLTSNNQDQILALLMSYGGQYADTGTTLGKAFADNLLAEIKKAEDALTALQNGMASAIVPETPTPVVSAPTTPTTPPALTAPSFPTDTTSSASPSASSGSIPWDGRYYRYGSTGDTVKRIQQNLNAYGYGLAVDGIWGAKTNSAVRDFQSKNGLSVDGIIGALTWAKLIHFSTGGYTGDFEGGKLAVLDKKERVLNATQTKAFEDLVYNILPKFYNLSSSFDSIKKQMGSTFNEPVVKNDITIHNNTPFDVGNNMDNLNKAIKKEIQLSGFRTNLI